jgi:hypothetical protein
MFPIHPSICLQRLRKISKSLRIVKICEVWSLMHKLQGFENKVLREMSGSERDGGSMKWWILHGKELHGLCGSPSVVMLVKCRRLWTCDFNRWKWPLAGPDGDRGILLNYLLIYSQSSYSSFHKCFNGCVLIVILSDFIHLFLLLI